MRSYFVNPEVVCTTTKDDDEDGDGDDGGDGGNGSDAGGDNGGADGRKMVGLMVYAHYICISPSRSTP